MKKKSLLPLIVSWIIFLILCIVFVGYVQRTQKQLQREQQEKLTVAQDTSFNTPSTETQAATTEATEATTEAQIENPLVEVQGKEMNELIQNVLKAVAEANADTLRTLDQYPDTYQDETSLKKGSELIEAYTNIKCYAKKGKLADTYVVFAQADAKVKDCETLAPGMFCFYIVKNSEGKFRIDTTPTKDFDLEVASYLAAIQKEPDVIALINSVNQRFQEACQKDEKLKQLVTNTTSEKSKKEN